MPRDPEYVAARRVLLDTMDALDSQRQALVLVGAQAVYLRAGESGLALAPYTTDCDLLIDPGRLDDHPVLSTILKAAGFELAIPPGIWTPKTDDVHVDFLVPASLGGRGRRGARLGLHGDSVARKVSGLEASVVDHSIIQIGALEPADGRVCDISVAGVAALLVAKLHKIMERKDDPRRLQDKDALDVLRLLRCSGTEQLATTLRELSRNPISRQTTGVARSFLLELFGDRNSIGTKMAVRSIAGLEDETAIALSCEVLAQALLNLWK